MSPEGDMISPSGVTFRQLQIFVATAEGGSITTAAERLFLSQTAVSLAMRQLEKELGATLMVRRRAHGITLTSTGKSLLPLGRNILASVADFGRSAHDDGQITGSVTVGCFPSLGPAVLPALLEQFMRENPGARIQFSEAGHSELMEMLEVGAVDLVLSYRLGLPSGLTQQVVDVCRPGVLIAADHPLAQNRNGIRLHELVDDPFIMLDSSVSAEHARTMFTLTSVFPEVCFKSMNFETVRSLAGRRLGWSFTLQRPRTLTTHEGREVRILPVEDEQIPDVPVVAVRSPGLIPNRATQAFLEILERQYPGTSSPADHPDLRRETAPATGLESRADDATAP